MVDHLLDLQSDFSVFHRIDDIQQMPAPRFFAYAYRIGAYGGVISALSSEQQQDQHGQPTRPTGGGTVVREVTFEQLMADPAFGAQDGHPPVIEYTTSDGGG